MPLTNSERSLNYRTKNPETFRESLKKYWAKKYTCECGAVITNKFRPRHKQTQRHQLIMRLKEVEN